VRVFGVARRRRYRRKRVDPALFVVAGFALALVLAWLASRSPVAHRRARPALTMAQARAVNARIPFAAGPLTAAAAYHFRGTPAAREQAIQCLATAALYEAGADPINRKAVIQVVLNRARLEQYPATICGVVYQGSALPTGCQFSFACDGSQQRRPEHAGWTAARGEAARALAGYVDPEVGRATHYHTDWTVPYWVGSLDKIAQVRSHIFYKPKPPGVPDTPIPDPPANLANAHEAAGA
jgi:spore germination cell wall hydrolase CwlJ-like protein